MVNIICLSKEKMTTQKVDSIDILAQTLLSESLSKNMYKMHSQNFVLCELKRMAKRHFSKNRLRVKMEILQLLLLLSTKNVQRCKIRLAASFLKRKLCLAS